MASTRFGGSLRQIGRLFSGATGAGQSDASLLDRFVSDRDDDAFAALVARHGPLVWGICRDVLGEPAEAEDAFQATFLILIRRARSIWVEDSLAGWLHRVARRVAVRARADSIRRRMREKSGAHLDAVVGSPARDPRLADLHEAIDRLPERDRRAVILCDLEGLTHVEAAQALRCGEATLRRRLASARDRLRTRLAGRGDLGLILAAVRIPQTFPAGLGWGIRPPTAGAELLARKVGRLMTTSKILKVTVAVGLGLATAATASRGFWPAPADEPKPAAKAADTPKSAVPVRWVHQTTDTGGEVWANLDDGREFRKDAKTVSLLHTAAHEQFTFEGNGKIIKTRARWYADVVDKAGRAMPPSAFDLAGEHVQVTPLKATEEEWRTADFFQEYDFDDFEGRSHFRIDQFQRDALGNARIDKQIWYDRRTWRPVKVRRRLQVADQHRFQREFETSTYDYPETGPADLAALGVPPGTPIVDMEKDVPSWRWADLPARVRDALTAQAEAVRRFPREIRVLSEEFTGLLNLEYWSATEAFVDLWCRNKTGDLTFDLEDRQPRHFRADNQEYAERPEDLLRAIARNPAADLPIDRIVAWFPFERSVNIGLGDGKRTYNLTRIFEAADKPRRTEVHVLGGGFDQFPDLVKEQWPLLEWNRRYATPAPASPDGMIVIKVHQPEPDYRCTFTLDPARDFIAVRQVEWSRSGDRWHQSDRRALRFKRLPSGSWYVSAWEQKTGFGGDPDKPADAKLGEPEIRRVDITPLAPDAFPKDIFDGDKFLDAARKAGAVIEIDQ